MIKIINVLTSRTKNWVVSNTEQIACLHWCESNIKEANVVEAHCYVNESN